jgi:VWFA-related protein
MSRRPRRVHRPVVEVLDADEVVRVETDLIPVEVVVTDSAGRSVRGLRPQDFKLFEDGAERPVSFFDVGRRSDAERPLAVVFALDTSGSMTSEEMAKLRSAVGAFAERLAARLAARPCVFAVMKFDTNVKRLQGFTNDRRKVERAF